MAGEATRTLHVITGLGSGGAEAMLARLVLAAPAGVTVCSLRSGGQHAGRLRQAGVPVLELGMRPGRPDPRGLLRLAGWMRRQRPDAVMSWLYHADLTATLAWLLADRPGRLVWNLRCADADPAGYGASTRLALRLLTLLSGRPTAIAGNALAGLRHHQGLGYRPRRWAYLPNGFDTGRFQPDPTARQELRQAWGLGEDGIAAVMVARADPIKDHAGLLAAFAIAAARDARLHLVLAGEGADPDSLLLAPHLAGLEPDTRRRVHPLGRREDIPAVLAACDLSVLSSISEGLPNAVGESMACGLPCLVTAVGDAARLLGNGGLVVPPRDSAALAAGLMRLAAMPAAARRQLGAMARQRIESSFSLASSVRAYTTFLQRQKPPRSRRERILIVIHGLGRGGAERVAALLSQVWASSHAVAFAIFDPAPPVYPTAGRLITIAAPASGHPLGKALTFVRRVAGLVRILRQQRPTRIVSFMESATLPAIAACLLTGRLSGLTASVRVHPSLFGRWYRLAIRTLYRLPARIVAPAEGTRRALIDELRLPASRVVAIPNPVEAATASGAAPPGAPPRPYLLAIGRLAHQKGFDLLLSALATLPELELVILGEGPERAALTASAAASGLAARVHLVGAVPDPRAWMPHALAFVLPSRCEGWPNALAEAMAAGCACVACDCPSGPAEMISDGVNGLLVPVADIPALAGAIARLQRDPALRARLGAAAVRWSADYAPERIAPRWLEAPSCAG